MLCINHKIPYHLHIKHIRNNCLHDFNFPLNSNNDLLDSIKTDRFFGITKPCTHFHPAPSTSTQLILTSIHLHPPPPSSFQSPLSSLQHPQQYLEQNIARNWAISPNLGRKIKSCLFWLKIGTLGILDVLIPNPDLDFWNLTPKSIFGQIWAQKFKVVRFVWKLVHMASQA